MDWKTLFIVGKLHFFVFRNVAKIKYGFVKLVVIFLLFTRYDYVIPSMNILILERIGQLVMLKDDKLTYFKISGVEHIPREI